MSLPQTALLSVWNKEGLGEFGKGLDDLGIDMYASGGTAKKLIEDQLPVKDVGLIVNGAPILGDRVKTLSREVHAGLLANLKKEGDVDIKELERLGIPLLGIVVVDMYPLGDTIASGANEDDVTEGTDVGGPTMLHSATKGRRIVLSRQEQREPVLEWLRAGMPDEENVRRTLAAVAEKEVRDYMEISAGYIGSLVLAQDPQSEFAEILRQPLIAA